MSMNLSKEQIQKAQDAAVALLERHGVSNRVAFDVQKLAEAERFDVYDADFGSPKTFGAVWINDAEGAEGPEGGHREIFVSADLLSQKRRKVIAHELGHYALHSKKTSVGNDTCFEFNRIDKAVENLPPEEQTREAEADCFARALLMPSVLLKNAWIVYDRDHSNGSMTFIDYVSWAFDVTRDDAKKRWNECLTLSLA
ncbi:MAG: ImmA/IrrE family metallo-endopeptidase [Oscillospiraceae bacterium]|jgi:hypothetical protein|nr:ImmA/IrrE family metallo-endopeptidase [Oscillospiraceae bacterium]